MTQSVVGPVVIDDDGAIEIYVSVEEACADLEAIDVRANIYLAFDADGYALVLEAVGWETRIHRLLPASRDIDGLRRRVRRHAHAIGEQKLQIANIDEVSIDVLIQRILDIRH